MRLVFLIRSLEAGGAERQLTTLIRGLDAGEFSVTVVTYYPGGELARDLASLPNVRVLSVNKRGRWDIIGFAWRLLCQMRELRPQIIHGYMYGANELALILAKCVGARAVWGVRASGLEMDRYDRATSFLFKTGAWLSAGADAIIANSEAGRRFHISIGYPSQRFHVIPNGIDTDRYRVDAAGRDRLRAEWRVDDQQPVIGIVGRLDVMKDHETFLHAAAILLGSMPEVRFAIVGAATINARLAELKAVAAGLGLERAVIWSGAQPDVNAVYSALDIATSSSAFGEGFSNALAEAMACERICVATDVGDARVVLGNIGEIVPPKKAPALASAWMRQLAVPRQERLTAGRAARDRIIENFSVRTLAARTRNVLLQVAGGPAEAA